MFVPLQPFQLGQIFDGKAGDKASEAPFKISLSVGHIDWLARYKHSSFLLKFLN
jgi:hypothetical protein